jgi:hypothetical protein
LWLDNEALIGRLAAATLMLKPKNTMPLTILLSDLNSVKRLNQKTLDNKTTNQVF